MSYIQDKWKRIKNKYSQSGLFDNASDLEEELDQDVFDLIEAVRQQSLTDYHNHIVEKIKLINLYELGDNPIEVRKVWRLGQEAAIEQVLSLLQDTNKDNI